MTRALLWLCALLVVGCAHAVNDAIPEPTQVASDVTSAPAVLEPSRFEVRIDAALSVEQQSAIVRAADKWSAQGFEMPVSIVDHDANFHAGECEEPIAAGCTWPGSETRFVLSETDRMVCGTVDGLTDCERLTFHLVALHELGHFFGILGHLPKGNVMYIGGDLPLPAEELTSEDVAAMREVWRQ